MSVKWGDEVGRKTIHRGNPLTAAERYLAARNSEPDDVEEIRIRRFHKAMALKDEIGLTPDERHELAQMIPSVDKDDGGSWKDLNPKQLGVLLNFMEGFLYVTEILSQRG